MVPDKSGKITNDEAKTYKHKNIITRAVGVGENVDIDFDEIDVSGGFILLCTDGLTNMISDEEIQKILVNDEILENKAEKLIKRANKNGGSDNITVMIINPFS